MTPARPASTRVFIFAGGGTGGHIYPGLAIAEQLQARLGASCSCLFVCSQRPIDRQILSGEGAAFEAVPAKPLSLRPRGFIQFCYGWGPSLRAGRALIQQARAAHGAAAPLVVAMGGFVAAPIAQAARAERCPVALVNLDAAPGKANRWIAGRANRCFSTFAVAAPYARAWTVVPPIVRSGALATCTRREARAQLGLDPEKPTLMVTGGSQGAGSINQFLRCFAQDRPEALRGWQILHQTGEDDNQALIQSYETAGVTQRVERFVKGMGLWWRAADLAISRAGAGSVAEAWASAVPTLFLPYPWHKDQHQRLNAQGLEAAGGASIATDLIDPTKNLAAVGGLLNDLLTDGARRACMAQAISRLGPVDGAARIAEALTPTAWETP